MRFKEESSLLYIAVNLKSLIRVNTASGKSTYSRPKIWKKAKLVQKNKYRPLLETKLVKLDICICTIFTFAVFYLLN